MIVSLETKMIANAAGGDCSTRLGRQVAAKIMSRTSATRSRRSTTALEGELTPSSQVDMSTSLRGKWGGGWTGSNWQEWSRPMNPADTARFALLPIPRSSSWRTTTTGWKRIKDRNDALR